MRVTDVKIFQLKQEKHGLKAFATLTFDESLIISDFRIINTSRGYVVAMPSKKLSSGAFKETVFPISTELAEHISTTVIRVFEDEMNLV